MGSLTFGKELRLCSPTAIDLLFAGADGSVGAWPLRAVWRRNPGRLRGEQVQVLFSVPKKRVRHAVDRVAMRRRIRQAYRLHRHLLAPAPEVGPIDIAFIYVADTLADYAHIERSVLRLLPKLAETVAEAPATVATLLPSGQASGTLISPTPTNSADPLSSQKK